jgi:hypothetical protein
MIYDLKNIGIPPKPKRVPWFSFATLVITLVAWGWMGHRDRELVADNQALVETVISLQEVIDGTGCGAGLEMIMPIPAET